MTAVQSVSAGRSPVVLLALGALGVVYGDIGTSPLYAVKESLAAAKASGADLQTVVYGVLSLVFWAVTVVVSLKYVLVIMRADNRGEGGIFALLALSGLDRTPGGKRPLVPGVLVVLRPGARSEKKSSGRPMNSAPRARSRANPTRSGCRPHTAASRSRAVAGGTRSRDRG